MKTFFVAMLLYSDVQKKAQDELDSVIGRDRLPTFEDRPRLPFIDAVCKETLRWSPIALVGEFLPALGIGAASLLPSLAGVPHAVTQDDVYAGFFIPKGASRILSEYAAMFAYAYFLRCSSDWKYMVGYVFYDL